MTSHADHVPEGRSADERWNELGRDRRSALFKGSEPRDDDEALTALGYGRRMRSRAELFALIAGLGAFVVYLAITLLMEGGIAGQDLVFAGGTGVGVGVALEITARYRARKLEDAAERALSE